MVVVARRTSKTAHAVFERSRAARRSYSAGENRTSTRFSFIRGREFIGHAHVMKEILLGQAGVRAEMRARQFFDAIAFGARFAEINPQRFFDPHIDREGGGKIVGEEENAVGDFFADAGKFAKGGAGFFQRQLLKGFEVELAAGNNFRGREEVRGAKSHFARAQVCFGERSEALRRWEGKMIGVDFVSVAAAERFNDLLDLDDLFRGREDEGGERFPVVLSEQAEAAAGFDGGEHRRVVWESRDGGFEIEIDLQILGQEIGVVASENRSDRRVLVGLRKANETVADDADEFVAGAFPAEGLAGGQRRGQIVIADFENRFGHQSE